MTDDDKKAWKQQFNTWLMQGERDGKTNVRVRQVAEACQTKPTVVYLWSSNCRRTRKLKDGTKAEGAIYFPSPERREKIDAMMSAEPAVDEGC